MMITMYVVSCDVDDVSGIYAALMKAQQSSSYSYWAVAGH